MSGQPREEFHGPEITRSHLYPRIFVSPFRFFQNDFQARNASLPRDLYETSILTLNDGI